MSNHVSLLSDDGNDSPHIGEVPLDAIVNIETNTPVNQDQKEIVDRDNNMIFKQEESFEEVTINFVLLPAGNFSIDDKREEVLETIHKDAVENDFTYLDYEGYLSVESVELPQEGSSAGIREGTITARYLPWPKYHRLNRPDSYEFFFSDVEQVLEMDGELSFVVTDIELSPEFMGVLETSPDLSMQMGLSASIDTSLVMTAGMGDDPFSGFGANFGRYFGTEFEIPEYALDFAQGDYVTVPDNSNLQPSGITVSTWVKPHTINEATSRFVVDRWTGYRLHIARNYEDTTEWYVHINGTTYGLDYNTPLNEGQTYLLTATYNSSTGEQKIYVDGSEVATDTISESSLTMEYQSSDLTFAEGVNGIQDDVRIYNKALSASQIQSLADGTHVTDGLVSYWPMDEGRGSIVRDVVGDNDGSINGSPEWVDPLVEHDEDFYTGGWGDDGWGEGTW